MVIAGTVADSGRDLPNDGTSSRPRPRVRWSLVAISSIAVLVCTGGPSYFAAAHVIHGADWVTLYPFAAVAISGVVLLVSALNNLPWRQWPLPVFPIAAFCALAVLSAWWTVSPAVTPRAALLGAGIAAFGCWFGWKLDIEEQVSSVAIATSVAVAASVVMVYAKPAISHSPSDLWFRGYNEEWIGIFGNRNSLSAVAALGILALVGWFALRPGWMRGLVATPAAVIEFITLRRTGGDTSLIALALAGLMGVALFGVWAMRRGRVPGAVVAGVAVGALVAGWFIVFSHFNWFAEHVGRSPTLSSRRLIWADVRGVISERPLLGHGYYAFWDRVDLTAATYARIGSGYGSAHNSMLEVFLMLGVVGAVVYIGIVLLTVTGVFRSVWVRRSVSTWWWAVVLTFLIAENLTESFVLWHSYIWMLFLAAALTPFAQFGSNGAGEAPSSEKATSV